jgi:hypothetical protein
MQIERCPSEVDAIRYWQRIIDFVCGSAVTGAWFAFKHNLAQKAHATSLEAGDLIEKGQEPTGTGND